MTIGQIKIPNDQNLSDGYNFFNDYTINKVKNKNIYKYEITFNNPISQLGIQGYPTFTFVINNSKWDISLGKTGVYELDLQGIGKIKYLTFEFNPPTDDDFILIDYIAEEG